MKVLSAVVLALALTSISALMSNSQSTQLWNCLNQNCLAYWNQCQSNTVDNCYNYATTNLSNIGDNFQAFASVLNSTNPPIPQEIANYYTCELGCLSQFFPNTWFAAYTTYCAANISVCTGDITHTPSCGTLLAQTGITSAGLNTSIASNATSPFPATGPSNSYFMNLMACLGWAVFTYA